MDNMDEKLETINALQQLIKAREAAQKRRSFYKFDKDTSLVKDWTLTQLHIVSAIKEKGSGNNTFLSDRLNISKPAITKAIKKMLEKKIIEYCG